MITYRYKALTAKGVKVNGVVEAVDEYAAVAQIKGTCTIVLDIKPVKQKKSILSMEIGKPKVDQKALSVMCSQFSIILKSGVPIDTCMSLISKQVNDKLLKKVLEKSAEDVAKGHSIASSFEKNCPYLPPTFIETIRAGEESGTLENSFETLYKYYDKSFKTKQKVKQAMSYPIFVLVIACIVLVVVMVKVIPTIATTFIELDGEMPAMTKALILISNFTRDYIWWIALAVLFLIISFKLYCSSEKGRVLWNRVKLKIPVLGNIALLSGAAQFANTMTALLTAGLSVSRSLEITGKVMDNYLMKQEINKMTGSIEEGKRLGDCMKKSKYFPDALTEMCSIGEETGELEMTLETIGTYYDNEAQYATTKAIQKLEPSILILMALFAGFIVIAIYLPMFTMYDLM